MFRIIGSIAAGATALFTPVVAAAATPSATPQTVITASTAVSNRPDSGVQGNNWALDTFTRVASVKLVGEVANTNCPGTDTGHCYLWDFTITDSGHFKAIAGQPAPRTGTLERALTGTMAGGTKNGQFYSSWKTAKAARVPATENDNGADPTGRHTTTNWAEQFFGASAVFNSAANPGGPDLGNWGWTYTLNFGTNSQCPNNAYRWVDAAANGGGSQPPDGNILTPLAADC